MTQRTVMGGRYALVSPLGRGGMGQVWEGRDERLGRPVAVKLMTGDVLAGRAETDDLVRRFTREAAVTAGLEHPGVPAIYDAGEYDGGLFLVMELVDGCTISDLIAEHGPLPVPWVAGIGAQVAAVLAVTHERGIIHRDIKPQNVMLTGEPVFSATSPAGLMHQHLAVAPARLRRDDLHPGLEALVGQLLAKDPAWRPADARETYDRLLPYVERPGPLGDIAPAAGSRSGLRLYSLVLARLDGTDLAGAAQPSPELIAPRPAAYSRTPSGTRWTLVHSLWVLPTLLFGMGTWLSFGYIAARHQRLSWLIICIVCLVLAVTAFALAGSGPEVGNGPIPAEANAGMIMGLVLWPLGFIHALWVNPTVRLPLRARGGA